MDLEVSYQKWLDLLYPYADELRGLIDVSEKDVHFTIPFHEILQFDEKLADELIKSPEPSFKIISTIIERFRAPDQPNKRLILHIKNLPAIYHRSVKDIGDDEVGHLRFTEAMVIRRKERISKILDAAFECESCKKVQTIVQDIKKFTRPLQCPKPEGGCGKRVTMTNFKFLPEQSSRLDFQWIYLQDDFKQDRHSRPGRIPVLLKGSMVQTVEVGQKVIVTHWPALDQINIDKNEFNHFLIANQITPADPELDLEVTETDRQIFKEIAPQILDLGIHSVAPQLMGYDPIKLSLFLQFIGAPDSTRNSGVIERGTFHILLFGEGGTGKSQLIQDAMKLWPVGYYSGAKNVTSAGLTYAVVKDEILGGWTLEAGVLILADGNLACIDELDKADQEQIGSMHMVMENQRITINKAGINADIPTHPTILAAANPKSGRIIPTFRIDEQCQLGRTLLQRFGLKWILINSDNPEIHEKRMAHSLQALDPGSGVGKRALDLVTLQKYRMYAQTFDPLLNKEVNDHIVRKYGELFKFGFNRDNSDITQRVGEDLIRISKAIARAYLRKDVKVSDVDLALWLIKRSQDPVINGENDSLPIDLISHGSTRTSHPLELMNIISRLDKDGNGVRISDFMEYCSLRGISGVEGALDEMYKRGSIYYPRLNRIQVIER